jgi:predicted ATPase/DNA-binding SARP family transcriptional activator
MRSQPAKLNIVWRIELLGGLRAVRGGIAVTRFRTRKTALLLAYLAHYSGRSHSRDELIDLLWQDDEVDAGRVSLRVALNSLRRQLEPPDVQAGAVIVADRFHVSLNPETISSDTREFEEGLKAAREAADDAARIDQLRQAIGLYTGEMLPDYYEDWVLAERNRLQEAYLGALRQVIRALAQSRKLHEAVVYARQAVQADPLREESHRAVITLEKALGKPSAAWEQFRALERILRDELDAEPSPTTLALIRDLPHQPRPLAKSCGHPAAPGSQDTTATADDAVALPTPRPRDAASRLPSTFTRLIGREQVLERIEQILLPGNPNGAALRQRLITLTGTGGVGKSRLAVEVARRLAGAYDGAVWFVPLAELSDPRRIVDAVRRAICPPETTGEPLEQVLSVVGDAPALLVLDNVEQIADGVPPVLMTLLKRAQQLACLVTSRRSLSVPGGLEIPLAQLDVPDASLPLAQLAENESVQLFVDRGQAVRPDFQVTPGNAQAIAEICRQLDGIPLAIELAAARIRALAPSQMLEMLRQRFEVLTSRWPDKSSRHRSVWAAVDWSYRLLPQEVQQFFVRLSAFRGGWTLDAAAAVCLEPDAGEGMQAVSLCLSYLEQLRSHSLIVVEEGIPEMRFSLLETLREFAAEHLAEQDAAITADRHAASFREVALAARQTLLGPEQQNVIRRLDGETGNIRAALDWHASEPARVELGLQMAEALWRWWWIKGDLSEGREWLTRLLDLPSEASLTAARANALNAAGILAYSQNDLTAARQLHEESLAIRRELGDRRGIALSTGNLANIDYLQGRYAEARPLFEECLEAFRVVNEPAAVASTLANLGLVSLYLGDRHRARSYNQESCDIRAELGDDWGVANCILTRGVIDFYEGSLAESYGCLQECLPRFVGLGDKRMVASTLERCAEVDAARGEYERCVKLLAASGAIRDSAGVPLPAPDKPDYDRAIDTARKALKKAQFAQAWEDGSELSPDQAVSLVLSKSPLEAIR